MDEAFTIPAEGPDVFRSFVLPIPIQQTRYVRGFEFRPGVMHGSCITPGCCSTRRD